MHGCGHDVHTAILYGALLALEQANQEGVLPWPVCWRGIFQPAEETNRGALEMVAAGAIAEVDAILALHVDPSRQVGKVGTRVGPFTAACDDFLSGPGLNENPNSPVDASATAQFVAVQANMFTRLEGQLARFAGIYTQQLIGSNNQQRTQGTEYGVSELDVSGFFSGFYTGGGLVGIRKVQAAANAAGDAQWEGIAKVWEAYAMGTAASIWGDIPYSEAGDPNILTPKLDPQEDVYARVQAVLDEAIALPTDKSARLALRTQQVLAYETDVTATVDPFAGSYVVERMTDDVEAAALELMGKVEDLGGAVNAIEHGFQKNEIERSAYRIAQETDSGERVVVGVNRFQLDAEEPYEPLRVDPAIEAQQAERLAKLRAERDQQAVDAALTALKKAAEGEDNVLYPMKDALKARATIGEVCNALREVWGTYVPSDAF